MIPETIIRLERLELWCIIGIHSHERLHVQPLQVDVDVTIPQIQTGRLASTIDYTQLADSFSKIAKEGQFYLIEDLAEALASHALSYHLAKSVSVTIKKPRAVPNAVASVSVTRHQQIPDVSD